jgi:hypothetical protein
MNDDQLNQLLAAARRAKPDTARVERGFETRLQARLRAEQAPPALWAAWTWRLLPAFAAVVLALGVWNFVAPTAADWELPSADQQLVADYSGE